MTIHDIRGYVTVLYGPLISQTAERPPLPKVQVGALALVPATTFLRRSPATGGGVKCPRRISSSTAHSNKIPTAIPIFSGTSFSTVPLPVSRDVHFRLKSKMAVAKMKFSYHTAVWVMERTFKYPDGATNDSDISPTRR